MTTERFGQCAPTVNGPRAPSLDSVSPAEILGRPVRELGAEEHAGYVAGATVAITGAAGSIGTQLSRRLVQLGARRLVLLDRAEAGLVELVRALEHDQGFVDTVPVLADLTRRPYARAVFAEHRPDVVFHAAACKQVPLLEANPLEAVASNVLGTKFVADAARDTGVERFVLFSTDKAVEPTSVLGRTKAVAEWIVAAAGTGETALRTGVVRLGNVADSAGSILPVFRRQLAVGEPVTVTHPEVTRFLMTVGEATELAVVAAALADSRSVFWVDIRPAVRVVDLVQRLATAAAREAEIVFVGVRPGERLHEQLVWADDEIAQTSCEHVYRSPLRCVDPGWLRRWVDILAAHVEQAAAPGVSTALREMHREAALMPLVAQGRA